MVIVTVIVLAVINMMDTKTSGAYFDPFAIVFKTR